MTPVTRRLPRVLAAWLAATLVSSACYHTILTTDLPPNGQVHREAFKPAFIAGLLPATVDASRYCQGGRWARVETQYSFLNWLVGAVTAGIFTPMDVRVFCATAPSSAAAPVDSAAAPSSGP